MKERCILTIKSYYPGLVALVRYLLFITKATIRKFSDEEGMHLAAGIAYYFLLSILPAALLFISIFSYFTEPKEITGWLLGIFGEKTPISPDFLDETIESASNLRGPLGIIGLLGLILTSTLVFAAVMRAINRAWGLIGTGTRSFMRRKLWEFALLICTVIILLLTYAGARLFIVVTQVKSPDTEHYLTSESVLWNVVPTIFFFVMLSCVLFMLYMWVPTIEVKWRNALLPAVLAAFAIWVANYFLGWYFQYWAYYDAVYGSLTGVIVLLLWVYVCSNILIIGAVLSSVLSTYKYKSPGTDSKADNLTI